uniref:NADH-ubiquinone oxidoreductase chain 2 n=1 Tax=Youtuus strigatus TaxID=2820093 RepID=A0A8A4VKX9_9HEMI|nr:NADH dehydrogenase subunit 2 [Youtuus strigatus]QTD82426.1 NADH dehydrogenase subunit 2 [Youtuus strigatus]
MLMNSTKTMFLMIMIISTTMMLSSSNILFSWMSMEINLIVFLPLISKSKKMKDQIMKYFIIQSLSSSILLLSIILKFKVEPPMNFELMTMTSLMMKTGMIPFHFWLPTMMEKLSWENCMIMNTWQKISPTIMFCQMIKFNMLIIPMIISLMMGTISMMKNSSMKKILAFSSIYNSPWMILSMLISKSMFLLFFTSYSMINIMLMNKLKKNNMIYMNQMNKKNSIMKFSIMINLISMSGMPPMLGFFPKWMILTKINEMSIMMSIFMILSSMISTFIYLKMISPMFLLQMTKKKMNKSKKSNQMELTINFLGTMMFMILKPN